MVFSSPFGVRKAVSMQDEENSQRFAKLKPTCVELLGSVTAPGNVQQKMEKIHRLLLQLQKILSGFDLNSSKHLLLSPSLINYVFFPIAQLLRTNTQTDGEADLPDRVRQVLFQILAMLAGDWWQAWTELLPGVGEDAAKRQEQWKAWEQLLILGAVALNGSPVGKSTIKTLSSEETQLAICTFLQELLLPRIGHLNVKETSPAEEWEWDGVEDLPSLDDYDTYNDVHKKGLSKAEVRAPASIVQVYPSPTHLQHIYKSTASRGALAHALSANLDVASSRAASKSVKALCLKTSRVFMIAWMGGEASDMQHPAALYKEVALEAIPDDVHGQLPAFKPATQADRVAVFLPGYISSLVRILNPSLTGSMKHPEVISQALYCLSASINLCLRDIATAHLLPDVKKFDAKGKSTSAVSIEELVSQVTLSDAPSEEAGMERGKVDDIKQDGPSEAEGSRSKKWIENTLAHIAIALHAIEPLSQHDHAIVQVALMDLAGKMLIDCSFALEMQRSALEGISEQEAMNMTRLLLRWLVDMAADDNRTETTLNQAKKQLQLLFTTDFSWQGAYEEVLLEELRSIFLSMTQLLASQREEDIERNFKRATFLLSFSCAGLDEAMSIFDGVEAMLRSGTAVDRWIMVILSSLNVENKPSLDLDADHIEFQGISHSASTAILSTFEELGRASSRMLKRDCSVKGESDAAFRLLNTFMDQAATHRSTLLNTSSASNRHGRMFSRNALIVADRMLRGVAQVLDDAKLAVITSKEGKKTRKVAHRLAKDLIGRVMEIWDEDEDEMMQQDSSGRQLSFTEEERSVLLHAQEESSFIEHKKGLHERTTTDIARPTGLGPALKLDFISPATLQASEVVGKVSRSPMQLQHEAKSQLHLSDALLLSILASCSKILGSSLKPLLLQMLYPVICGVASHSPSISRAAAEAIDEVARSAGYASVQGCVSDHADYILGTASHRLISSLGPELQAIARWREAQGDVGARPSLYTSMISAQSAPLVLVQIIGMLGGEALTLVQDAVDEVLDAIDRYHLQKDLCDNLLTVLDRLVEVMVKDERNKAGQENNTHPSVNAESRTLQPDIGGDMGALQIWWFSRKTHASEGKTEHSPLQPLAEKEPAEREGETSEHDSKPSSSQLVVVSILQKSIPFLSHSAASIRVRSLNLLNRGVELLCLQGRTVEPLQIINAAWPAIMSRLGFSLSLSLRRFDKVDVPAYDDLSERDFVTCTEAAKLVSTLARYLVEYLGSEKMLRQAVPRLLLLLKIVQKADGRAVERDSRPQQTFLLKETSGSTSVVATTNSRTFQPLQRYTPLYTMAMTVFDCLNTLINAMGPRITEADLYAFAVHPTLFSCLDRRQDPEIQTIASKFYLSTLSSRNENLVWLLLRAAKDGQVGFPPFLCRPDLRLGS